MSEKGKYRAPALQKGLEILELLAPSAAPMPMADISVALGRSVSEIFRMLQVLEEHGYISRSGEGYRITNRLFALGMAQPPTRDLLERALPAMRALAHACRQSCHLAVASGSQMVVIANVQAPGLLGFAIRMGYQRPLIHSASGHILLAFQTDATRDDMLEATRDAGLDFDREALIACCEGVRRDGYVQKSSPMLTAITDISCPILDQDGRAQAALTVPFVDGPATVSGLDEVRSLLKSATADISRDMGISAGD